MTLATLPLPGVALRAAAGSLDKWSGRGPVSEAASEATHGSRLHPFGDTSRRRRLVKVLAWLIGRRSRDRGARPARRRRDGLVRAALGSDRCRPRQVHPCRRHASDRADVLRGPLLLRHPPRRLWRWGAACPGRHGLRSRRRDEWLPACEHRHLRHPDDVRRAHPELHVRRRDRGVPRSEDLLHDRRHLRLPLPLPLGAGLVRFEPGQYLRAPGVHDRDHPGRAGS